MNSYQVDRTKWRKLTIFEQMGNIYSEVGRTSSAFARGDEKMATDAAVRAYDLFDATTEQLVSQKSPKLKEVLRVKEVFSQEFIDQKPTSLDSYFMPFAIAARLATERQFA